MISISIYHPKENMHFCKDSMLIISFGYIAKGKQNWKFNYEQDSAQAIKDDRLCLLWAWSPRWLATDWCTAVYKYLQIDLWQTQPSRDMGRLTKIWADPNACVYNMSSIIDKAELDKTRGQCLMNNKFDECLFHHGCQMSRVWIKIRKALSFVMSDVLSELSHS